MIYLKELWQEYEERCNDMEDILIEIGISYVFVLNIEIMISCLHYYLLLNSFEYVYLNLLNMRKWSVTGYFIPSVCK